MIRMDEFNKIRKAYFVDGLNANEIAIKFKRSWTTVNKIVNASRDEAAFEKKLTRVAKVSTQEVIDAIVERIEKEVLLNVKKKQRSTAKKIYEELVENGIYKGSRRRMQELVKDVREKLIQTPPKSFLPLEFALGSVAQVDHGEAECIIEEVRKIYYLFVMSVPGMALNYCQLFATKSQEAWGEFHEKGFRFFNGIFPRIIYDNDTVLIKEIRSENRLMTDFALHLVEHYGFEGSFCNPASGNEKGSVENAVGYCRRNYLNGCPAFTDIQQGNMYLDEKCQEALVKGVHYRNEKSLIVIKNELAKKLLPLLPAKKWRRWVRRQVNSYQLVEVDGHYYSAPEKFLLTSLRVGIGARVIELFNGDEFIVEHKRQFVPGNDSLFLDHYLDQLSNKPGALWDCKAIHEVSNDEVLLRLWEMLIERFPCLKDNQVKLRSAQTDFIEVLMLKRRYTETEWRNGIKKAMACGATSAASIDCIIQGIMTPEMVGDAQNAQKKLVSINIPRWECDLSSYALLTEKVIPC
jgi:transposase